MKKSLMMVSLLCLAACATAQEKADAQNCQLVAKIYQQNAQADFTQIFEAYKAQSGLANGSPESFMNDVKKVCGPQIPLNSILGLQSKYKAQFWATDKIIIPAKLGSKQMSEIGLGVFAIDELKSTNPKPQKDVIYKYDAVGLGYKLVVFQNTDNGIIVVARNEFGHGDTLLHLKTKQKYADGDNLESGNYVYDGLFKYNSILGVKRTIYSFKEVK